MRIAPCKYCGSDSDCFDGCECAKCVDPEGYEHWKMNNPEEYSAWLEREEERYYSDEGGY